MTTMPAMPIRKRVMCVGTPPPGIGRIWHCLAAMRKPGLARRFADRRDFG
jgi:hypothetical protein